MSIRFDIPKTAIYKAQQNTFLGTFNAPTLGKYDFAVAGNTGQLVTTLDPRTVYLLSAINLGATIPEAEFLYAIGGNAFPQMTFRFSLDRGRALVYPIPVVNYIQNQEVCAWVYSEKTGDRLLVDFTGILDQSPFLVGLLTVRVSVQFTIWQITDTGYVTNFKQSNFGSIIGAGSPPFNPPQNVIVG